MITISHYVNNCITIATQNRSVADLSLINIEEFHDPIFYFNRIKVPMEFERTGEGKELMIEVCRYADQLNTIIYNQLNPYGKRDMKSLKSFFRASGFEDFGDEKNNIMIRRPNNGKVKI